MGFGVFTDNSWAGPMIQRLHRHGIAALASDFASDLDFQSASPSVVKSIKQRDLLNT